MNQTLSQEILPVREDRYALISALQAWSKETARLTRFTDSYLLQVRLLDVGEVLNAGDVEAISDTQVELLQLDVSQELVQPLSVLVHQHDPADLPAGGQRLWHFLWYSVFKWNYVSWCFFFLFVSGPLTQKNFPILGQKDPIMNQRSIKSLSNSNFTPILVLWGYHGDLTKSPWCKTPEGDCSAFNYAPAFNELFVCDLWDGTSLATNWLPDGNVLKWKSYILAFKNHRNVKVLKRVYAHTSAQAVYLLRWWKMAEFWWTGGWGDGETNTVTKGICAESLWRKGCCRESWGHSSKLRGGNIICCVVSGPVRQDSTHTGFM